MKHVTHLCVLIMLCTPLCAQNLPEVFSAINFSPKEGHSATEIANMLVGANRGLAKHGKGIGFWLSYGDRGVRQGKMSWGFTFDFVENRDYYFPVADDNTEGANPQFDALQKEMQAAGINPDFSIMETEGGYTDFICIAYDALINPKIGELSSVRSFTVKPGSEAAFEKFVVEELYPGNNSVEGLSTYIFKADRGENKGVYLSLWSFESVARRNELFPNENEGVAEEHADLLAPSWALTQKAMEFMEDSDAMMKSFTDYVAVYLGE